MVIDGMTHSEVIGAVLLLSSVVHLGIKVVVWVGLLESLLGDLGDFLNLSGILLQLMVERLSSEDPKVLDSLGVEQEVVALVDNGVVLVVSGEHVVRAPGLELGESDLQVSVLVLRILVGSFTWLDWRSWLHGTVRVELLGRVLDDDVLVILEVVVGSRALSGVPPSWNVDISVQLVPLAEVVVQDEIGLDVNLVALLLVKEGLRVIQELLGVGLNLLGHLVSSIKDDIGGSLNVLEVRHLEGRGHSSISSDELHLFFIIIIQP